MIRFQLVTLSGVKFDQDVYEVILPTLDGQIGVLTDHMPLISAATTGVISVRKSPKDPDSAMDHFATFGGVDRRLLTIPFGYLLMKPTTVIQSVKLRRKKL